MLKYLSIWLIYIASYLYNIYTKIKIFYAFNFHPLANHRQSRLFPNYKQFATKGVVGCKNLKGIGKSSFCKAIKHAVVTGNLKIVRKTSKLAALIDSCLCITNVIIYLYNEEICPRIDDFCHITQA